MSGRQALSMGGLVIAAFVLAPALGLAAPFSSPNHLVVLRLGDGTPSSFGSAQSLHLDEWNVASPAPTLVQGVDLPASGGSAVTLSSDPGGHDGLLNRSADGQYLVLGGYRANSGAGDPALEAALSTPRVIARIAVSGAIDVSTALTDSYNQTIIRAVATDDGTRFWVAGDNANGDPDNSLTGGLRFVASVGSSTSVNLSQVQAVAGPHTPDNVRSVGIFAGQLFDSSGSASSIGKAVFQVGSGLPTSGSQTLATLTSDGASTNAFYFADLSPAVAGIDTLYSSASAAGIGLHKYSLVGGAWESNGFIPLPGIAAIAVSESGASAVVYATDGAAVFRLTDATGYNAAIGGAFSSLITAGANQSFRGLAFAPSAPAILAGDYDHNGVVEGADLGVWRGQFGQFGDSLAADGNHDGQVDGADMLIWQRQLGTHASAAARVVPEPAAIFLASFATMAFACGRRRLARAVSRIHVTPY